MSTAKPYRYLLVDLDGTLLDGRGGLSPRNASALHRAVAAGMRLVLASGRTYLSLLRVTGTLPLPPFHIIANGGAVALSPGAGEVRYLNLLPEDLWPEIAEGLEAEGLAPVVFGHRHPEPPLFHVGPLDGDPHHASYVSRNSHLCRLHDNLKAADIPDVVEVAALGREPAFVAASERMLRRFGGRTRCHSMELSLHGAWGKVTEFFAPGTSKWRAMGGLFPEAAAHPETVIAIGDEANDLEMIREAGLGIAMGNAIEEVKAAADQVTSPNGEDGVAEALERILG
ncbi:MAG: HAD family hydrolase [bacterium]